MLKTILKKLLLKFIGKKLGLNSQPKYYKPKKRKGLAYKLKKVFD